MIDIKILRENPNLVKEAIKKKNVEVDVDKVLMLDKEKRDLQRRVDDLKHLQKMEKDRNKAKEIKEKIKEIEKNLSLVKEEFEKMFKLIPNLPFDDVPVGKDDSENIVVRQVGKKREFTFKPKSYLEVVKGFDYIDIERAAKISGSRFGYLKRKVAFLEIAIINFVFKNLSNEEFINNLIKENSLDLKNNPFEPIFPPVMIKPEYMEKMGYLDRHPEETYFLKDDDLVLVGTSEQSVGAMFANESLLEEDLPLRFVGFSTCFRREAGSYGKDTKGILRVHQFDKLEMFSFVSPETSKEEHKLLLAIEEKLMNLLEIPYQVIDICTGDLGDTAAKKYDIEAWMPGQKNGEGEYRETHSTSNCTDFQSRRLKITYKDARTKKNKGLIHTLNGTAFAIGRLIIAIIENYQKEGGDFEIPSVLKQYFLGNEN